MKKLYYFHSFYFAFIFTFYNQWNRFNLNIAGIQPIRTGIGDPQMFDDIVNIHRDPFLKFKSLVLIVNPVNDNKTEIPGDVVLSQGRIPAY